MNLLALPDPAPTLARMAELGVLAVILPEAEPDTLAPLVAAERRQDIAPDPMRRLAALLPADVELAGQVAARFRLSGAQKKRLVCAAGRFLPGTGRGTSEAGGGAQAGFPNPERLHQAEGAPPPPSGWSPSPVGGGMARTLAYRLGMEQALDRLLIVGADTSPLKDWAIPTFPLKGGEIVARGVKAGPDVARILRAVEDRWVNESFPGGERVVEILHEELQG
jgi:poly(A) polymerase